MIPNADERIERYILLNVVGCPEDGDPNESVVLHNGRAISAETLGVDSKGDWVSEVASTEHWMRENPATVRSVLHLFGDEWPDAAQTIHEDILPDLDARLSCPECSDGQLNDFGISGPPPRSGLADYRYMCHSCGYKADHLEVEDDTEPSAGEGEIGPNSQGGQ